MKERGWKDEEVGGVRGALPDGFKVRAKLRKK
jgi:hypothetical protein